MQPYMPAPNVEKHILNIKKIHYDVQGCAEKRLISCPEKT